MNNDIQSILLEPLRLFTDPAERVWWGALAVAFAIAMIWEYLEWAI